MYSVLWPRGMQVIEETSPASRLDSLEGKTVGELWGWIYRGDVIFPAIERELARRFAGIRFVSYEEFGSTHGAEEAKVLAALPEKLKETGCEAVISGVGC
ncbi:MAG: hypothetical protein HYY32_07380 [Chloroflexi bacterium]|nr:hypothetical protein [Chloroflexota bacterium]